MYIRKIYDMHHTSFKKLIKMFYKQKIRMKTHLFFPAEVRLYFKLKF